MIDLGKRTLEFAVAVRRFLKSLPQDKLFFDDARQLIRSSGSVGANYIEANESLSRKDFLYRIKICLKEAKESHYWLKVFRNSAEHKDNSQLSSLIAESAQLVRIFASIAKSMRKD